MRKVRGSFAAAFAVAAGLGVGAMFLPARPALAVDSWRTQQMHRLYNPNSGEHFYTSSDLERDTLVKYGWRSEGEGWTAPIESDTPVYRLYNPNAGDHLYTRSAYERDLLVKAGWKYEGIGWYSSDSEAVPLYRQYNPNAKAGSHNYTTSKAENNYLVKVGWRAEGIGWYGTDATSKSPTEIIDEGQFGEGCTWRLYGDGRVEVLPTDGKSGTMAPLGDALYDKIGHDIYKVESIVIDKGVRAPSGSAYLFSGIYNNHYLINLRSIDAANLDFSESTTMYRIFAGCKKLTDISSLSAWDVSNVTGLQEAFIDCRSLTDLTPISRWNVSKVRELDSTFCNCRSLTDLTPISGWDVSHAQRMHGTFANCANIKDVSPLSRWDVSNVNTFDYMFNGCEKLADATALETWQVNTENTWCMFANGIKTPSWYKD